MSKYTGPKFKIARRLNYSISETGIELQKRAYAPGQHGLKRSKLTEYGIQLHEKQKVRFTYGVNEKQFKKTFDEAQRSKGKTGDNFIKLLESRLDNLVYRLGFARTRAQARQLVNHGHILVNGKKVDIPSYRCQVNSTITLKENSKKLKVVLEALEAKVSRLEFLSYDEQTMTGTFIRYPERKEVMTEIQDALIVEYYNR